MGCVRQLADSEGKKNGTAPKPLTSIIVMVIKQTAFLTINVLSTATNSSKLSLKKQI